MKYFRYKGRRFGVSGIDDKDWIYRSICDRDCFYEIELLTYMNFVLRGMPEGCVIDVGANIGNHSVYLGAFVASRIIAFEPNPAALPIIRHNLEKNRVRFLLLPYALGSEEYRASIQYSFNDPGQVNYGAAYINKNLEAQRSRAEVVVSTLDKLNNKIRDFIDGDPVVAMKVDVEGMELDVLKGAKSFIRANNPEVFVEALHPEKLRDIVGFLGGLGYYPVTFLSASPVWHFTYRGRFSIARLFFLKIYAMYLRLSFRWRKKVSKLLRVFSKFS